MCLRRSKKVNDASVIDFRQIQMRPMKSPSLFKYCLPVIQYSVKRLFQSFQKAGLSTKVVDPFSAVQNRAMQRIILAAGLVVFLIALVQCLF